MDFTMNGGGVSALCFPSEGKYEFLLLRKLLPCWSGSGCCTALTPDTKNMETFSFEKNWGVSRKWDDDDSCCNTPDNKEMETFTCEENLCV